MWYYESTDCSIIHFKMKVEWFSKFEIPIGYTESTFYRRCIGLSKVSTNYSNN